MSSFKPSHEVIVVTLLIDWKEKTLQTVVVDSFTLANILWLAGSNIVLSCIRRREDPVGIRTDVQAAKIQGKLREPSIMNGVAEILRAFSLFDRVPQLLVELLFWISVCCLILILTTPPTFAGDTD
jgi:hypothetical protein